MVQKQFHINENKTIHVDTMIAKHKEFNYSKNKKCKVLAIPYKVANLPIFFSIVQWTIWHGFCQTVWWKNVTTLYIGSVWSGRRSWREWFVRLLYLLRSAKYLLLTTFYKEHQLVMSKNDFRLNFLSLQWSKSLILLELCQN